MATETWIVNASPVTLAKAGYLHLFDRLTSTVLIPEAVVQEILSGPPSDPARKALESGWGIRLSPSSIPEKILEWGLGAGESAVLALALEQQGCTAVLDDEAARRCALALGIPLVGTLGAVLRSKRKGFIPSAVPVLRALRAAGLRLDDKTIRTALASAAGEDWPERS